jgi:integrase
LIHAYLGFAKTYYVKHDRPTGEYPNVKDALRPLSALYGRTSVAAFGPIALKTVRQAMIDGDLCRRVINSRVNRIRRALKWGVENELVPATVLLGLQAVAPLKHGRSEARETAPVRPVPEAHVKAVLEVAPPQLAAMIELQRLSGMRPGELVLMRSKDLDTSGPIWVYTPPEHKTEHHGRSRCVYLGPQAQRVLRPLLKPEVEAFLFSPADVMALRRRAMRQARVTPLTPSQAARRPLARPDRAPGNRYTTLSYARAIAYACDRAFPHPELSEKRRLTREESRDLAAWRREHRWSPNRLRHNAATALRKQFGIEAARVVLGHGSTRVTEIYAEQDLSKAAEIMGRVG